MTAEAPTHEEVVHFQIQEAKNELVAKVNACHENCRSLTQRLADIAVESINEARKTGLLLLELQEQTPEGQWMGLFSGSKGGNAPQIAFSWDTGRLYIKLANAMPEPIKTLPEGVRHLKDMLIACHALPASEGHGEQTRHEERSPFQALVKLAGEMQGCVSLWRKAAPTEDWSPELKMQVKSQLEPLVKFYQTL